jgi:hypothetical protein
VLDSGGDGSHSIFAAAFLSSLDANSGVLVGSSLFTDVRERVGWNASQIPEYSPIFKSGHGGGDFLFVRLTD